MAENANCHPGEGVGSPFLDVESERWSVCYIKQLVGLDITSGIGGGRFGPEDLVTREQMAAFITRALGGYIPDGYCGTISPFTDVRYSSWSCKWIKSLPSWVLLQGMEMDDLGQLITLQERRWRSFYQGHFWRCSRRSERKGRVINGPAFS